MALDEAFVQDVVARLGRFMPASSRKMFGGAGIYAEGVMFALVSRDNRLYLRTDDSNRPDFVALGSEPFMSMPYHEMPASVWDDPDRLAEWARTAWAVARAHKKPKKKR